MAVLNAWQKLTRVLPGKPFGNGSDGDYSSATIPTLYPKSCSGSASSTTLNADTDANPFSVGDVVMIHQTRGTGVGQWEVNRISSVGTDQYTLQEALHYTYTDSGASQAQVVEVKQYADVTVQSGTWTVPAWDGNVGGVFPIAVRGTLTITGSLVGSGLGFLGGTQYTQGTDGYASQSGEGDVGARVGPSNSSNSNNGSGGGGGMKNGSQAGGGAGGGNGSSGGNSSNAGGSTSTGGTASGSSDLVTYSIGGGGGGGRVWGSGSAGNGGNGGAGIILFVNNLASVNSIASNGSTGASGSTTDHLGRSGGGAGGSILIVCQKATLGSSVVTATGGSMGGGTGGASTNNGGAGSVGRIAVHHSGTVTGTTSPTFEDVTDTTLKESTSGMFLVF